MKTPVEITFRNTPRLDEIGAVVHRELAKLERYGLRLVSCRVAIEQPQRHQQDGNRYRVRLSIGAGLRKPIVVTREPRHSDMHEDLRTIVLGAFRAARRQLQSETERRRGATRPPHEPRALVVRLFPPGSSSGDGYGFLKTADGREVYFHRNAVLHDDYERLAVGTEVRFEEEEGDKGPQASTVQVVNKPGVRLPESGAAAVEPPRGWHDAGKRRGARRKRGSAA
ncbi:MAG: cold shock domain-containing protein [Candidatus Rokuibacteriota bacterium]